MDTKQKFTAKLFFFTALVLSVNVLMARESNSTSGKTGKTNQTAAGCTKTTAQIDLDINNIRTRIRSGGDMWWDGNGPKYEVPKVEPGSEEISRHSIFAGALWFGGIDAGGQLKIAAQTYRENGDDFWTGPLDDNASINSDDCAFWDYHFKITRAEVDSFLSTGNASDAILNWPAKGNTIIIRSTSKFIDKDLAPYVDMNENGIYDPEGESDPISGWHDYPKYDVKKEFNCKSEDMIFGDQTIFWIINDKGNIHSQSSAEPIGLEIHCQAFAFATSDEINNMTFYDYTVYNKSTVSIGDFYMAQWVDTDLGDYEDDYTGCDVSRGLGYCYNGDPIDGPTATSYPGTPPAVGLDFFRGPIADANDGIDNDKDGTIDENGELIIMSNFTYFNRVGAAVQQDPEKSTDYYGFMSGFWKDGTCVTRGGNGYAGTECVDYMFPDCTDPKYPSTDCWTEDIAGNAPGDRRFVQSAGPFTLQPGAVNKITIGAVWAQASSGDNLASVALLKTADDKAQALFDNCFQVLDGPDAPKLTIVELNRELILNMTNPEGSNNYAELYNERDPVIDESYKDTNYVFQGYLIYQVENSSVSTDELNNIEKARLIFQCDKKDLVENLVNYEYDSEIGGDVAILKVKAANEGIKHSIKVTTDLFAKGDNQLINFKKYHFIAITYAHNEFDEYDPTDPLKLNGQKKPYMAGRKAAGGGKITAVTGIPHKPGTLGNLTQAGFGDGPEITQITGLGNGGNHLELTEKTISQIIASGSVSQPVYQGSYGPVKVTVVDPVNVPCADFMLYITGQTDGSGYLLDSTARWMLVNSTDNDTVFSDTTMDIPSEQLIISHCVNINSDKTCSKKVNWGLAVTVSQVQEPGDAQDSENGILSSSAIEFEIGSKPWLGGITDQDGITPFFNWIRSGNSAETDWKDIGCEVVDQVVVNCVDPESAFESILSGTWAPYRFCSYLSTYKDADGNTNYYYSPIFEDGTQNQRGVELSALANVDLVITSDQTKWSKCVVVELGESTALTESNRAKMDGRGYGMFPGYAIDLDKGKRLAIIYGEDSWWEGDNGRDLEWNPTANVQSKLTGNETSYKGGGKHWIYILNKSYDAGVGQSILLNSSPSTTDKRSVYKDAMWVSLAHLVEGYSLLESEVTVKLRVNNAYHIEGMNNKPVTFQYSFNTDSLCTITANADSAKNMLELINIVPNPYYSFSGYETSQIDNRVKFTNLPGSCVINIYTFHGALVRKLEKEGSDAYLDWDIKNSAGVPVSSGIYIIHINVPNVGEKILKFFCVMRPQDLDTF